MDDDRSTYIAYMLRLWLENDRHLQSAYHTKREWRASLQNPHTEEILVFDTLAALFDFLSLETTRLSSEGEISDAATASGP